MDFSSLQRTSKITDEWRYPEAVALRSGLLQVDTDPDHHLYWEEYGNSDGEPVMFLHGGPGGACAPAMARFFNPDRYRVILFDQRGCGKSEPTVASAGPAIALANNTTQDLLDDINRLRDALGIQGKMHVFGGSWGSTLAMVYAIAYPQHCASLVLRGIFLGSVNELRFMYQGNAANYADDPYALTAPGAYVSYPEAWSDFLAPIDPVDRGDMIRSYKKIFDTKPATPADEQRQLAAAQAWSIWEGTISNAIPEAAVENKFGEARFALCFAQIEGHFFANNLFLEPCYILRNVGKLASVPVHIVHGRFDLICPLTQASSLAAALHKAGIEPAAFVVTNAGHSAMEVDTALALTAIMDGLPRIDP
jgi:proline iminopeptidase